MAKRGNPYAFPININGELRDAIDCIIKPSGFGISTFFIKKFLEDYKQELIALWNQQNRNGLEIWQKYYDKFNKKIHEQIQEKEREEFESHKKSFMKVGFEEKEAEELANLPKEALKEAIELKKVVKPKSEYEKLEESKEKCVICGKETTVTFRDIPCCNEHVSDVEAKIKKGEL